MFLGGVGGSSPEVVGDQCVDVLDGDPERRQSIRTLIARLHKAEGDDNGPWVRWTASQLLRVLWFCRRDEPVRAKIRRVLGRLANRPHVGAEEIQASLLMRAESNGSTVDTRSRGDAAE
jgi:hypothetical protein